MKTCRYCIYYNSKYENCKNQPINVKLNLKTAAKCPQYIQVSNNLKVIRNCKRLKKGEREELILQQRKREDWQMRFERRRNINRLDFSYRARANLRKNILAIHEIENRESNGGSYEIEDDIIERLDKDKK